MIAVNRNEIRYKKKTYTQTIRQLYCFLLTHTHTPIKHTQHSKHYTITEFHKILSIIFEHIAKTWLVNTLHQI